ncbi:MAG: flagellar basal body-associated FliL family protein [Bdellovibrionales bacterium]|nr:flagellar basal body-associated FliL family protein [Bdellovibrionales bacterium]
MSEETEKTDQQDAEEGHKDDMSSEELELVDQLIDKADPEFKKQAEQISEVAEEINPDDIEIEEYSDDIPEEDVDEQDRFQKLLAKLQEKYPKMVPIFQKFESLKKNLEIRKIRIRNQVYSYAVSSYHYLKNDFPSQAKTFLKNTKNILVSSVKNVIHLFFGSKKRLALSLILITLFSVSAFMLYKLAFKKGWLPSYYPEEITSFSNVQDQVKTYNPANLLALHEAFPEAEYSFKLKNIVVNLKSSQAVNSPAFASIVFYLSLDSTDTAVEIKDREIEILDATQRTLEQFSYQNLSSIEGQKNMLKAVKQTINEVINQGFVKDVYIKHKILKPETY